MKRIMYLTASMVLICQLVSVAQVTTAGVYGKVTAGGEEAIGASVAAKHLPTGIIYNAITNTEGRYTIQGMYVGGPYEITFTYIGFQTLYCNDIHLQLGELTALNVELNEDTNTIDELIVTGKNRKGGNGSSSHFYQDQIENTPVVHRNIYEVAKQSPLVNMNKNGGITIAGTNNRYNSFQIDGVTSNDMFGLTSSGTNGGQTGASPISLDAIQEIQIVASPFNVRQSGFTGGAINAVTKSGTNQTHAAVFSYHNKLLEETSTTYGATIGGPIIKNKLFFFVSAEQKYSSYPAPYYAGQNNYFLSAEAAKILADRYYQVTGHQETFGLRDIETSSLSLMGRMDWHINLRHNLTLRYQFNKSFRDNYSLGEHTYYYNNSGYRMKNQTASLVAELNSNLHNSIYNEARISINTVRDIRDTPYKGPLVNIRNAGIYDPQTGSESTGGNTINIGTEFSSGVNSLDQNNLTVEDNLSWSFDNHTLTFGTHNELYSLRNGFIQAAFGEYVYGGGISSFLNDYSSSFIYKYSDEAITNTTQWKTPFCAGQMGVYAQDRWDISTAFQLTYGIRFDIPVYFDKPSENTDFNSSAISIKKDAVVGRRSKSYLMISPRVGFRWQNDNHNTLLRGGLGIFNGRAPFVWIENAWANTGVEMKGITIYSDDKEGVSAPQFSVYGADVKAAMNAGNVRVDKPAINTIDRHFRFPQALRINLAWEQKLPWDIRIIMEGLFTKSFNNIWFENLALVDNGKKVFAVEGSTKSSTIYYNSQPGNYSSIVNLTNTNKGYSYSMSTTIEKMFTSGLDLKVNYTFGHSYSVNDGISSVALSNWGYYYCTDPNHKELSNSIFDIPHRILFTANYHSKKFGKARFQLHASLTYNGCSGQKYSLTMADRGNESFNGDYRTGNTLLYIPTESELATMHFTKEEDREQFRSWILNDGYACKHRGQFAERNSNTLPWENHFDLHITQDFYFIKKSIAKISFVLDIINVANLLNHSWGTYYVSGYAQDILSVTRTTVNSDGNMLGEFNFLGHQPSIDERGSRWRINFGIRATF